MEKIIQIPYEKLNPILRAQLELKIDEDQEPQQVGYTMTPIGADDAVVTIRVAPVKKMEVTFVDIAKYFFHFGLSGSLLGVGITLCVMSSESHDNNQMLIGMMLLIMAALDLRCAILWRRVSLTQAYAFSLRRDLQLTTKRLSLLEGDVYTTDDEMLDESDSAAPEQNDATPKTVEASTGWTDPNADKKANS